ncbi:MAG: formylglycine-generating enzyme family protein [Phycisphaerae bacterium]
MGFWSFASASASRSPDAVGEGATATARPSGDSGDSLAAALEAGRFGMVAVANSPWRDQPGFDKARRTAIAAIDERLAFVPEGFVSLALTVNGEPGGKESDHSTSGFMLARHAVTNAEYQRFVDADAYGDYRHWPEDVLPHVVNFKDRTGKAGPRLWQDGRHDKRLADHPVVGISFVEAQAYAAWIGMRLPTEIEWQMAASWRIRSEANVTRRYAWGDSFDLECCNVWHSGHGHTLSVNACPAGASPNGVLQLIGNVWEWTASDFAGFDSEGRTIVGDMLMKSIRGGAFDTYFPWQATSTFRSGAACLARVHNIGFRCCMDLIDG